jgi:hypothetical protein
MRIHTANKQIDVFDTDIFLVSYPRSGNTWMRWLLAVSVLGRRDVDRPEIVHATIPDIYRVTNEQLLTLPHPRIVKSHERYNAGYPRVIYIYRDVRDVMISLFFYFRKYGRFANFASFFDVFVKGNLYRDLGVGGWDENVMSWLAHSDDIAMVKYEDLLADTRSVLAKTLERVQVAHDKNLVAYAADLCTFEWMHNLDRAKDIEGRADLMVQGADPNIPFIRKGTSGQWKGLLSPAQIDVIKQKYGDLLLRLGYETSHDW